MFVTPPPLPFPCCFEYEFSVFFVLTSAQKFVPLPLFSGYPAFGEMGWEEENFDDHCFDDLAAVDDDGDSPMPGK